MSDCSVRAWRASTRTRQSYAMPFMSIVAWLPRFMSVVASHYILDDMRGARLVSGSSPAHSTKYSSTPPPSRPPPCAAPSAPCGCAAPRASYRRPRRRSRRRPPLLHWAWRASAARCGRRAECRSPRTVGRSPGRSSEPAGIPPRRLLCARRRTAQSPARKSVARRAHPSATPGNGRAVMYLSHARDTTVHVYAHDLLLVKLVVRQRISARLWRRWLLGR
jgi:hypothetical protein